MALPPYAAMLLTIPVTGMLAFAIAKKKPNLSSKRIAVVAAAPTTAFIFAYFIWKGAFVGSADDWEGLTHVFAPIAATILIGLQFLLGRASATVVLRMMRAGRGHME